MEEKTFGKIEVLDEFRGFALAQCSLVKRLFDEQLTGKTDKLKPVLGSICQTTLAIAELSKKPEFFYAEMVMLARAFIEKTVNCCYLHICDTDEFERYFKHTLQKSYRKLNRELEIGEHKIGLKFLGEIDTSTIPGLSEAIFDFTGSKGNEKTHWTSITLENRIKLIAERTGLNIFNFMLNTLWVYEDASEALHGTLYGCTFHSGAYDPNLDKTDKEAMSRRLIQNATLILCQIGSMIHDTITLIGKSNDIASVLDASQKNHARAVELMRYALGK